MRRAAPSHLDRANAVAVSAGSPIAATPLARAPERCARAARPAGVPSASNRRPSFDGALEQLAARPEKVRSRLQIVR